MWRKQSVLLAWNLKDPEVVRRVTAHEPPDSISIVINVALETSHGNPCRIVRGYENILPCCRCNTDGTVCIDDGIERRELSAVCLPCALPSAIHTVNLCQVYICIGGNCYNIAWKEVANTLSTPNWLPSSRRLIHEFSLGTSSTWGISNPWASINFHRALGSLVYTDIDSPLIV